MLKYFAKKLLDMRGLATVRKVDMSSSKRIKLLSSAGINLILDVGANNGSYGKNLREMGYRKKIISFEPMSGAYEALEKEMLQDALWVANKYALGSYDGEAEINISKNSDSSSILNMLPEHVHSAPDSVYIDKESIKMHRLDSVFNQAVSEDGEVFLKVDTQGYEMNVLEGAEGVFDKIMGMQLELSLIPLYQSTTLFIPMIDYLRERGFVLMGLEPGFSDPDSGRLLQVDGIFFRENLF